MLKLLRYLKPYWWQVLLLVVVTVGEVYATLQLPALTADIINNGIVNGDTDYIWQTGLIMAGIALGSGVCSLVANIISARVGANFSRDLRAAMYKKVMSFNTTDMKTFSTASLINRTTNDVARVQETVMILLSVALLAPLFCVISLIMAIQTAPDMSWIIAVGVVAVVGSATVVLGITMPKFKIYQKLFDRITLLTRENLTGLKVVRAFNNDKIEKAKFEKTNDELTRLTIFVDRIMKLEMPLMNIIMNGLTLLCT